MQRFPDLNTTEVLQRIPGVTITRDQGEGRYVHIRGTEARLNNVTVNGQMVASPEDEERYVGLDVIGASQFSSIEVTKAITPDMDAEAIGGSVNLVTKSAFDRDERRVQCHTRQRLQSAAEKAPVPGQIHIQRQVRSGQEMGSRDQRQLHQDSTRNPR